MQTEIENYNNFITSSYHLILNAEVLPFSADCHTWYRTVTSYDANLYMW